VLDSYIEIAASEDGRTLCLSGNCALESCVEKAHIYVLNVDEQAKIKNTASLSTRKPDQTTTISPPVPKPRAIHHEEHEQQNSHGTTKPLTKVQQEIAKVNEGTKKLTLGSEQNTNGTRVSQQSHSLPSQANGQKSKYMPGKYEKQEKIGSGAFGVVHKCWDIEQQRLFAAKYTVLQSDENYAMAQNEIQRLKDLDHPRVIDYYGCSTEHDRVVLFMEYMVAGSLRRVIDKHGPISEKNSIHYIDQILDGLTYIHGRGIVHRDLKCETTLS
uniref:Protein kinase domain-containing protein n=1 Tax=Plectus sambesii TaxID=2011161 RepID=A0A914UZG2_9BILA